MPLPPWEPENLVLRNRFVAERSKCPDKSKHNLYTMLAVFSAEPDAQYNEMNSQDTDRLRILTEFQHVTEVRHESSLCVF